MFKSAGGYSGATTTILGVNHESRLIGINARNPLLDEPTMRLRYGIWGHALLARVIVPGETALQGGPATSFYVTYAPEGAPILQESAISMPAPHNTVTAGTFSVTDGTSFEAIRELGRQAPNNYYAAIARGALKDVQVMTYNPTAGATVETVEIGAEAEFAASLAGNEFVSGHHFGLTFIGAGEMAVVDHLSMNGTMVQHAPGRVM